MKLKAYQIILFYILSMICLIFIILLIDRAEAFTNCGDSPCMLKPKRLRQSRPTFEMNAGLVKMGDFIEIWDASMGYIAFIAPKDGVQPVPSDCYLAKVNGEVRINLDAEVKH